MGWSEKGRPTPFDTQPVSGLFFLDGDLLARQLKQDWTKGQKFPTIVFPSGIQCDLWESSDPNNGVVHIFGEMDLPLRDTRDSALAHANAIAEQVGYFVRPADAQGIEIYGDDEEHVVITYDSAERLMTNVVYVREQDKAERPRPELLDQKTRETLPPLYSGEKLGLSALAQVKFFTPDSNWTWYGSEFDGEDVFFGLVDGFELELGYFSLSELKEARGPLGLPIERDRYFTPTSLKDLKQMHERARRGEQPPESAQPQEPPTAEAERLLALKDELLARFRQLPPEHQATLGLVLVKTIIDGQWGDWFRDALTARFTVGENALVPPYIHTVNREDLRRTHLNEDQIQQLSDTDLTTIAKLVHEHFITDAFWDELEFIADLLLAGKKRTL